MFKWIFLTQACIYLLLMPFLRSTQEVGYYPTFTAGFLAVFSFCIGLFICKIRNQSAADNGISIQYNKIRPSPYLTYFIPPLSAMYIIVVLVFGLLNRRQGSEYMAELYAGLPIYALGILRIYEIILIPVLVLYVFSASAGKFHSRIVFLSILISMPFTGLSESRSKLLLIAMYMICFIKPSVFIGYLYKNIKFYIGIGIAIGLFVFYSIRRSSFYYSTSDYLLVEIYQRLDGLSLVTDLRDSGFINPLGHFDLEMLSPLLSKIPFIESARTAKLLGRTSTKQYYLQDLLGRSQFDTSNSAIADPLYFAGYAGVIVSFFVLGYLAFKNDLFVKNSFMKNPHKTAISIAFVSSFAVFENDMMGMIVAFVQNYLFIAALFIFGTRSVPAASALDDDEMTYRHRADPAYPAT